ncbi:hypothetical protein NO559_14325 [Dasania sp. GY-MA-18]|uniref:Uncharacterized protein n=1 Tax=Dasania phycosphaerae TaxID=2950436 RepID=A0A9J6RNT4_9GAMM|nr:MULTISPECIES: hypothetical protein [Dasania]MCR8923956.1 hypothetical protein [Dasania sp. GY-MA-18]MCZ0866390.1 hypothetical protein [Dasania phycosphaerae]MCZ0870114.1 hypothetical protein [Dasania phycosphaerae]
MIKTLLNDTRKILKLYGLGAILFFIGVGFMQWADGLLPPSLQQELVMLLGLSLAVVGFSTAMLGQCLLIVQRFKNMGKKP